MPETGATSVGDPRFTVRTVGLLAATGLALWLCVLLAAPFVASLAWALALAVLFAPLQRGLERRWRRPNLAAVTAVALIALLAFGASSFVGQRLYVEVAHGAALVERKVGAGEWRRTLAAQPFWARLVERIEPQVDLPGAVRALAKLVRPARR